MIGLVTYHPPMHTLAPPATSPQVELDGGLLAEVHPGVVFKETGANNSVYYMKV